MFAYIQFRISLMSWKKLNNKYSDGCKYHFWTFNAFSIESVRFAHVATCWHGKIKVGTDSCCHFWQVKLWRSRRLSSLSIRRSVKSKKTQKL